MEPNTSPTTLASVVALYSPVLSAQYSSPDSKPGTELELQEIR